MNLKDTIKHWSKYLSSKKIKNLILDYEIQHRKKILPTELNLMLSIKKNHLLGGPDLSPVTGAVRGVDN